MKKALGKSLQNIKFSVATDIFSEMLEAEKRDRASTLKEVKRLCNKFGFTAGIKKGSQVERRKCQ